MSSALRRRDLVATAVASAVTALLNPALAQERVEITGSIIKRVADEGALPVTTIKAAELTQRGHTELKDLLLEMPQSLSAGTNAGAAGPVLNLRGLGPMRTLTLLNGRRLANEPLQDQYVSISVIPRMALERTETLRDGASSTYGADAIGGVQNFYTKSSHTGFGLKVELNQPEASGGGETKSVGFIGGVGDLARDGWNAYVSLDHQRKSALFKGDRRELFDDSVLKQVGLVVAPSNVNPSPTANFGFAANSTNRYNPTFATGCLAPYSLPTLGSGSVAATPTYSPGCYRDPMYFDAVTDGSEITNLYGKATWAPGGDHRLTLELLHTQFLVQKYRGMQSPAAVQPLAYYTMPSSSRFYPGAGITPTVQVVGSNTGSTTPAVFIDAAKTPGTVTNLNMGNRLIYFVWGPAELGSAYRNDEQTNDRVVLSADGSFKGWDYRLGLNAGQSKRDTRAGGGYILYSKAQEGFNKGILNPFGLQDAAGLEYLRSIEATDYTYRLNRAFNTSVDATLSRDVMALPGGALVVAGSVEMRRDAARVSAAPTDYILKNADGTPAVDKFGVVTKTDLVGEAPVGVARKLHRDIASALIEAEAPVHKMLTLNASVRADNYSDLKTTTINPKVAFRLQPAPTVVVRGSANTGFRAPSIMDIQNPTPEVRTVFADDPVLCPSKSPLVPDTGAPVAGYTREQVCNVSTAYWTKSPDNSHLKPETSRGFSLGTALEPMKGLSITLDYWGLKVSDALGALVYTEILANPAKYAAEILRRPDGTIDHLVASQANRGDFRIRGVDLSVALRLPPTALGTFDLQLDGQYYQKYEFTTEKGGAWRPNVGIITADGAYGAAGPNAGLSSTPQINFRWKHTASVAWRQGVWRAQLSQRYNSGVTDLTPRAPSTYVDVKAYAQYNAFVGYTGFKNISLGLAVNNLANATPPVTANTIYQGYATSIADILGRAYRVSAEYTF